MELLHKPDFEEAKRYWRAFWEGSIIDRPCCRVTAPKDGIEIPAYPPSFHYNIDPSEYRNIAEQFDRFASSIYWAGEAVPVFGPNFGPDIFAAFYGAELDFSESSPETSWAVPFIDDWSNVKGLFDKPGGKWWERTLKFYAEMADVAQGRFIGCMPDLHGNLDGLAAIRGPQKLCEDLLDFPEQIDIAMLEIRKGYAPVYDEIYRVGKMESGTSCWLPYYSEKRFCVLQCDFITMISPAHLRRWVIPALTEEASYLDHSVFHYDGPGALVHLEDILSIKEIHSIQWTPGDGQPPLIEWIDLLKRIQTAGKGLYISATPEEVKVFHKELKPEGVFYNVGANSQKEADELLKWLKDNT